MPEIDFSIGSAIEIRRESRGEKKSFLWKQKKTNRAESKAEMCATHKKTLHFSNNNFPRLCPICFCISLPTTSDDNYKRSTFTKKNIF